MKKFLSLVFNALSLPLIWFSFLLTSVSGIARYFYLFKLDQNNVIRFLLSGFWKSSVIFALLFLVILAFWIWKYLRIGISGKNKVSFVAVAISSIFTLSISQGLLQLENSNYPNYLYSTFGLTRSSIELVSNISLLILLLLIGFVFFEKMRIGRPKLLFSSKKIATLFFLGILIWYSALFFLNIADNLGYSKLTYPEVFTGYDYIEELNLIVPQNAKVILPEQSWEWPALGNLPIVRYFLYPRILISSSYIADQKKANSFGDAYFIVLRNDADGLGWPKIDEKNKRITFKGDTTLSYQKLILFSHRNAMNIYRIVF